MLTIYKASAGSGKTFTLTYRYIKLLLGFKGEDGRMHLRKSFRTAHRSILAITFTNKATDEMKRRIIHELAVLAGMEPKATGPSPYLEMLRKDFGCSAEALVKASGEALRNLLFDFHYFQVSTIDSFFQLILRTFAREAELTGNYEVDLNNDRTLETGVRNLFNDLTLDSKSPENARIIRLITKYLEELFEGGEAITLFNRKSRIFQQFIEFIGRSESESFKNCYAEMMEFLTDHDRIERFRRQLQDACEIQARDTIALCRRALDLIDARGYRDKMSVYFVKMLEGGIATGYDSVKNPPSQTAIKGAENPLKVCKANLVKVLDKQPDDELLNAVRDAAVSLLEGSRNRKIWRMLASKTYLYDLLDSVFRHVEEVRNENNTLLLSDTNTLLNSIIGEGDTPFVFERIGLWLNHFLIDEFQDTSRLQWKILSPLVREGQATDCDSLIIGDEKQCIYRFRASDPSLLNKKVFEDFPDKAQIEGDTPEGNTNWRSSRELVTFNNALFRELSVNLGLNHIYSNVTQRISPKHTDHHGFVRINQINPTDAEAYSVKALELMTDSMRRQLRSGSRGGDIAVLTRTRPQATMVIDHLMQLIKRDPDFKDIRVVSDDAMMLASSPAVRMIISVLRYLESVEYSEADNPAHASPDLTAAQKRRKRDKEIKRMLNRYEYLRCRGFVPEKALEQAVADPEADWSAVNDDIADIDCFNLTSLVERIIVRLFTDDELDTQNIYIAAFQDAVADYSVFGQGDLRSFLDWWDKAAQKLTVSAPVDGNAVRVMTIHKSKGLEFKCVHIPLLKGKMVEFRDEEWFPSQPIPLIDPEVIPPLVLLRPSGALEGTVFEERYREMCSEQLLDELNVLYVALTRGVDELCVNYMYNGGAGAVGTCLNQVMEQLDFMEKEEMEESDGSVITCFTLGAPTSARASKPEEPTALDPQATFAMPPYHTADRDDLWENTRIDDLPDYSRPRDRGVILHDVLSRVRSISDLPKAVAQCVHSSLLPASEAPEVEGFLRKELSLPEVAPWFSDFDRVICERPLVFKDGTPKRPDRVVWTADGHIDVIDYKFGGEAGEYYFQVRQYINSLRKMGYESVRGFIWYVTERRFIPVE